MTSIYNFISEKTIRIPNSPTAEQVQKNTKKFQQMHAEHVNHLGRHFIEDPLSEYDTKITEKALQECKSLPEWKALEANDIRINATGIMKTRSIEELLERYKLKIQHAYRAEIWFTNQLTKCQTKLVELQSQPQTKSTRNKIKHWTERKLVFELGLASQIDKTHRYERMIMKWLGVIQKIRIADIAKEIKCERWGNGNKYGFNPNMSSRETATDMFQED